MRRRSGIALAAGLLAAGLALAGGGGARAQGAGDACWAPSSTIVPGAPLVHTKDRLLHGLPLKIVALGSSSTAGAGASNSAHAYPAQLAAELKRRFPRSVTTVLNRGINGEEAPQMLARLERDVLAQKPDLVIWQTGSNEILRRRNSEEFRHQMIEGVKRLQAAQVDLILMDAQYAPTILANPDHGAFITKLRKLAAFARVPFLDRFEAMRYWMAKTGKNAAPVVGADQTHMTDVGYHCIGELAADAIAEQVPGLAAR